MLFVFLWGSLFGVASLAASRSKLSKLLVSSSISSCSLNYTDRFTLLLSFVCKYPSLFLRCASVVLIFPTITDVLKFAIIGKWSEVKT